MTYRIPSDVGYVIEENDGHVQIFVMRLPDGAPFVLEGSAGLIWRYAVTSSDLLESVAESVGENPDSIEEDVMRFLVDLVAQGLLESDV